MVYWALQQEIGEKGGLGLIEDFRSHFRRTYPQLVGCRIAVALSGGSDSVTLLHWLKLSGLCLEVFAVHVHHGVRGADADADADFCRALCISLNVPFDLRRLTIDDAPEEGREAGWRRARYEALELAATAFGAEAIATGHHRDDIAEGVLLQILRGAGPRALAGIAATSGKLIRPLLPWSHDDLQGWLRGHDIAWREDLSNLNPEHLRNRVRHEVLPRLETVAPALRRHLCRLAEALAHDDAYMAAELERAASWIEVYEPDGGVPITTIAELPRALRVRWLHAQAARTGIGRVTHRQGALLQALLDGSLSAVTLANRWVLRRATGRLWLEPPESTPAYRQVLKPGPAVVLALPGWCAQVHQDLPARHVERIWRRRVRRGSRLALRSPQAGDRMPDGRPVVAILRNGLPRHLRSSWPILVSDGKILWIPGLGVESDQESGAWTVEVMRV